MSRILCIANQKGGVGKTTTAVNLAVGAALGGEKTLLVDLDPQCNATSGLGCRPLDRHPLVQASGLRDAIVQSDTPGLGLLPGSHSFRDVTALADGDAVEATTLGLHLAAGLQAYDLVLVDCPPSLGSLTRTALAGADEILIPIQCEYFAMEGLTQMIEIIREVMHARDGRLQFGGIALTMLDHDLELTAEVEAEVREFFGDIVYETVIPRDVAVSEAASHGQSVIQYAPRSRGARAYIELCMEVLERV